MSLLSFLILFLGTVNLIRMAVFIIGSDIYAYQANRRKAKIARSLPKFSVIIPAHNEEKTILRAIRSVVRNHYPRSKRQIIVVDDGSVDQTFAIAQAYQKRYRVTNLKVTHQPQFGKAPALNNALKNFVRGELVMCLDSDSYLHPDALRKMVEYFQDPRVVATSANVKIIQGTGILNLVQQVEYLICYQMKRAQTVYNIEYIIGGIGSTFRRDLIKKIGYYDANTVTEDIDLTMKILQLGNRDQRVIYGAEAIAYTEAVLDFGGLMRQRFRWKWGRAQTFLKNWNLFFNRDRRFSKSLTFFYLPYAIFGDISFLLEPIIISYIFLLVIGLGDVTTFLSTLLVMSSYTLANVLLEKTLTREEKIRYAVFAPVMYLLFYAMSLVEYAALIKTLWKLPSLRASLDQKISRWDHVKRVGTQPQLP